ncbi:MAG TPA: DUF4931 domain-containing protein [Candidatus Parcubacteria bacterium]|nr:DUF4931 domain-containing protein [Candidatus Parcubacteria bacterium]
MASKNKKIKGGVKSPSELRLDLINGDWVVVATGRAKRPEDFKGEERKKVKVPKKKCPFCNIKAQEEPTLVFVNGNEVNFKSWKDFPGNWTLVSVPNKYPAFSPYPSLNKRKEGGLYQKMNAVGYHEVIITKDHIKDISRLPLERVKEIFDAYQKRYLGLMNKRFVNHIFIFHNHGPKAGASLAHPHSQIITTYLVDSALRDALRKSETYFEESGECIYCKMNKHELRVKKRIVFENESFIAICPFASKTAFQVTVSPKKHLSYFEKITEEEKWQLAEAFKIVLGKINKGLNNPDYNFYLRTAPCDGKKYDYYHWHWTILPKTSIWAGFEMEAKMEISTIEPEEAAEYLRKQEVK